MLQLTGRRIEQFVVYQKLWDDQRTYMYVPLEMFLSDVDRKNIQMKQKERFKLMSGRD